MRKLIYLLFAVSGFSGLIYESIWSHYLKLFLGHAAFAQTLVLCMFMGGMALGSWLVARFTRRLRNLLRGYALAEGFLGIAGLLFHRLFEGGTGFVHASLYPLLETPEAITALKWGFAALLILPQSVALGMTFPLMTGALARRYPESSGSSIAMLYFTNSFGAALGVLASGFLFIAWVGLPGTIMLAGLLNLLLACLVWLLGAQPPWREETTGARSSAAPAADLSAHRYRVLLTASLVTGVASFIYEIGWIRMLSLVLGSSTHAFEMMLSAFILGLALGSLWIRRRIDVLPSPVRTLALVQLWMGALALASLFLYGTTFDLMSAILNALERNEAGYVVFNVASHGIALLLMLPVTFCAGMTLPLITHTLMREGHGEKSIGAVYAMNTVGAIVGILIAVHLAMPGLGLKNTITLGAILDLALGIVLLALVHGAVSRRLAPALGVCAASLAITVVWGELDPGKLASGVYRVGAATVPYEGEVTFHRDGKTATVNLIRFPVGVTSINTNGKVDASINLSGEGEPTTDELTQTLVAVLPLAVNREARSAAAIGFGSGMTTHVLLASPGIERVDTIEIEPAMVQAAQVFRPRVERAYADRRSRIHYEDAKTFFSTQRKRYDVIISEPSQPWVSGIASLYTREFYAVVARHLAAGGVFVQWLHTPEMNIVLLASVMKALAGSFANYTLYNTNDRDLVILAGNSGPIEIDPAAVLSSPPMAAELARIGIVLPQDLAARRIASRTVLGPYFDSYAVPANSDYFPILDLNAVKARFLEQRVREVFELSLVSFPLLGVMEPGPGRAIHTEVSAAPRLERLHLMRLAMGVRDVLLDVESEVREELPEAVRRQADAARELFAGCPSTGRVASELATVLRLAGLLIPYLAPGEADRIWNGAWDEACLRSFAPHEREWVLLVRAVSARDPSAMAQHAEALLREGAGREDVERRIYLVSVAMLGRIVSGDGPGAQVIWAEHGAPVFAAHAPPPSLRLLLALSASGS